jgi:hypothetical protein
MPLTLLEMPQLLLLIPPMPLIPQPMIPLPLMELLLPPMIPPPRNLTKLLPLLPPKLTRTLPKKDDKPKERIVKSGGQLAGIALNVDGVSQPKEEKKKEAPPPPPPESLPITEQVTLQATP